MYYRGRVAGVQDETITLREASTRVAEAGDELAALIHLGFRELGGGAVGVGTIERAIADRVFSILARSAEVSRWIHGRVAGGVASGIRGGADAVGRGTATAVRTL